MKSIEEKARAYDEALERAKIWQNHLYEIGDKDYADELNYLFSELAESADERIRKWIIENIQETLDVDGFFEGQKTMAKKAIAWLEKQANHANFRNKIQIGDKVTRNEDGVLVNLSQLNRVAKKDEKQAEQKPANNVEPKFREGDSIQYKGFGHNRYTIKEVCGLSHYINTKGNRMDMSYTDANFEVIKDSDKVEISTVWSEEDYNFIKELCDLLASISKDGYVGKYYTVDLIERLKSLRPQNRWKPNDIQIECLSDAIKHYNSLGYPASKLKELLDDLKKLMEE